MPFATALAYFGLVTMFTLIVEMTFTYATKGFGYGFSSNRDPSIESSPLATRIQHTYQNQVESAAYVVPVLAAAALAGLQDSAAETAALVIVVGRALFPFLYYTGIPFIRVLAFGMGTFSTLFIVYRLLASGVL
jgi:uncharacterized MAPEG superfamily protein